jgi:hypothetical protein
MKASFLMALCLLASCEQTTQLQQEWRGTAPAVIEFGAPFEIELWRRWPEAWQADAWNPAAWAPFEAELLEEDRRQAAGRIEVRRRLRLRAYALGEQQLRLGFSAFDPVRGQREAAPDLELSCLVQSSLPQGDAGQAEMPPAIEAPSSLDAKRRSTALALLLGLFGAFAVPSWWRRRRVPVQHDHSRADLWSQFRAVQEMPRSHESERRAALQAARALVRGLEVNQAWTGPELAQRLARRFSLPRTEAASLAHFLQETEAAVFADQQELLPAMDPALDELAEVLRAVDSEEVR